MADSVQPAIQHESVDAAPILSFVVLALLGTGLAVWLTTFWFEAEADMVRQRSAMEARYPEVEQLEVAGRTLLTRYALQPDSSYAIPIERAMELVSMEFPESAPVTSELP